MATEHQSAPNEQSSNQSWFLRLQRESWYMEMITSAFVIFLLFKVPGLLGDASSYIDYNLVGNQSKIGYTEWYIGLARLLPKILIIPTYAVLVNLIVHLFLRCFWIGVLGITSLFAKDIQFGQLNYNRYFTERLQRHVIPLHKLIQPLDNICSSIYGISLYIVFLFISLFLWLVIIGGLIYIFFATVNFLGSLGLNMPLWLRPILFIFLALIPLIPLMGGFLYFIDFITLGVFRKSRTFAKVYSPIYRIVNIVTLSFLYNGIYYAFLSNFKKWKVGLGLILYLLIIYSIIGSSYDRFLGFPNQTSLSELSPASALQIDYYDNLRGKSDSYIRPVSIPSAIVEKEFLRLFIAYDVNIHKDFKNYFSKDILPRQEAFQPPPPFSWKAGGDSDTSTQSVGYQFFPHTPPDSAYHMMVDSLNQFYKIYVDDSLLQDLRLRYARHPNKEERGFMTYIPVYHLSRGEHRIKVTHMKARTSTSERGVIAFEEATLAEISFWKAGKGTKQTTNKDAESPKQFPNSKQQ